MTVQAVTPLAGWCRTSADLFFFFFLYNVLLHHFFALASSSSLHLLISLLPLIFLLFRLLFYFLFTSLFYFLSAIFSALRHLLFSLIILLLLFLRSMPACQRLLMNDDSGTDIHQRAIESMPFFFCFANGTKKKQHFFGFPRLSFYVFTPNEANKQQKRLTCRVEMCSQSSKLFSHFSTRNNSK